MVLGKKVKPGKAGHPPANVGVRLRGWEVKCQVCRHAHVAWLDCLGKCLHRSVSNGDSSKAICSGHVRVCLQLEKKTSVQILPYNAVTSTAWLLSFRQAWAASCPTVPHGHAALITFRMNPVALLSCRVFLRCMHHLAHSCMYIYTKCCTYPSHPMPRLLDTSLPGVGGGGRGGGGRGEGGGGGGGKGGEAEGL